MKKGIAWAVHVAVIELFRGHFFERKYIDDGLCFISLRAEEEKFAFFVASDRTIANRTEEEKMCHMQ